MSRKNSGYNNPAFCNQFDSSLYDYEYVPEIDPDSPNLERRGYYQLTKQVPPWNLVPGTQQNNNSDEFENSDESNRSIIVEECNNRRVTLICEKRPTVIRGTDGSYTHNVSLESADSRDENDLGVEEHQSLNRQPRNSSQSSHNQYDNQYGNQSRNNNPQGARKDTPIRPYQVNESESRMYIDDCDEPSRDYRRCHRYMEIDELEAEGVHFTPKKPRAPSPIEFNPRGDRSPFTAELEESFSNHIPSSSPLQSYPDIEMHSLSPPRGMSHLQRRPPIGASSTNYVEPKYKPKSLQKLIPRRVQGEANPMSPTKFSSDKRFIVSSPKGKVEVVSKGSSSKAKQSARRNIASSFSTDQLSPYRTTVHPLPSRNTAIITPILQRKFSDLTRDNIEDVSRRFQSTGNVLKGLVSSSACVQERTANSSELVKRDRLKRNQSFPNFYTPEKSPVKGKTRDECSPRSPSNVQMMQMSPTKSPDRFSSPISRSRMSLLENLKSSWSDLDNEIPVSPSSCILFTAGIQLLVGMVNCGICFYLMSKLGRLYYLDFGMLAGFVNIILGGLGFRAKYWKWLPNRNYVSGYIVLTLFSLISCAALSLIITVRPMAGSPVLDMTAGAILGISVLILTLAFTGLTMSSCCKVPPPDNRVSTA